ncbi:hypothetical protein DPMN_169715 [Dreissena polymorpha]|uniref:Uncharacterized protein n=1 Tax=Dreissena polymorpha TaxID=45954 RepID=A0A9D4IDL7_DREPO|nr:hypothetical protein DPMN_169715 [Dreissena polymorpha]
MKIAVTSCNSQRPGGQNVVSWIIATKGGMTYAFQEVVLSGSFSVDNDRGFTFRRRLNLKDKKEGSTRDFYPEQKHTTTATGRYDRGFRASDPERVCTEKVKQPGSNFPKTSSVVRINKSRPVNHFSKSATVLQQIYNIPNILHLFN